jgi:hypothetical protein
MDKDDHEIECLGSILVRQPAFYPMPVNAALPAGAARY